MRRILLILLAITPAALSGCSTASMSAPALTGAIAASHEDIAAGESAFAWIAQHGGVDTAAVDADRVAGVLRRFDAALPAEPSVVLIDCDSLAAFSWPDGRIVMTRGLLRRIDDDELCAAIAHELGHLLADHRLTARFALRGDAAATVVIDPEIRADAIGCRVLTRCGIDPRAMARLLSIVAADRRTDLATRTALLARIRRINARG